MPALSFLSECPVIWCVRRPFSHVRLLVTLRTQSARLLCPFSFKHCASCAKPLIYLIVAYIFPIFFSFSITKEIVVVQLLSHDPFVTSLWPHELQHTRLPCLSPSPKFAQTLVHWVGDAIQPSHPLLSSSPPALSFSQHQGLFHGVSSLYHMAQVLELQFQHQSFQLRFKFDFL